MKSVRRRLFTALALALVEMTHAAWVSAASVGPLSPAESQKTLTLADPALSIELVASEPDVTSPVAIAWDENQYLYVAEMIDYPIEAPAGRIRRLEDRDGDGKYETSIIFADGLPCPSSVLPCYGGLLITAAPDIWFVKDTDGDGRADLRQPILSGFNAGNTQLRVNGLTWGLDNFIYVANGRSDGDIVAPTRSGSPPTTRISIRHRDVRFRLLPPDGLQPHIPRVKDIQAIAGFSQFGLPHDDWGNRFPSWNTIPIRHVVIEQQSLDRNPYLADTLSIASILDPRDGDRIFTLSSSQPRFNRESVAFFNASCGPIIYRGDLLPSAYRGNAFVCEPLTNLVHRRILEPVGVTFNARRAEQGREFLASTDPSFRPVNLANGPDGALYVVDMYRELVEHPEFVPKSARNEVDFRRWHNRGRIWRIKPANSNTGSAPKLDMASGPRLVALLAHPNGWYRSTAQRLIVERSVGADSTSNNVVFRALRASVNDQHSAFAPLHALWTLAGLDLLDQPALETLLVSPNPGLREHAIRALGSLDAVNRKRLIATSTLVTAAKDPAMRVRLQCALALGDRCRDDAALALPALVALAGFDGTDPWMRTAILSGLADSALPFVIALHKSGAGDDQPALLAQAAAIIGTRRRESELLALIEHAAQGCPNASELSDGFHRYTPTLALLSGLAEGLERSGSPFQALIATPSQAWKPSVDRLAQLWPVASALTVSNQPVEQRLIAIDLLTRTSPDLVAQRILEWLNADRPRAIQSAAARSIARIGRPSLASEVLSHWHEFSVSTRRELLVSLTGSADLREPLIAALESKTIAVAELNAAARQTLEAVGDVGLRLRAHAVLSTFVPARRADIVARYQGALRLTADLNRGQTLFARNCQTCHLRQGQGHRVGPDLSGIAGRAADALLNDILDPNRDIEPDFITLSVATKQGQVYSGLLAEETAATLKLRKAEAVEDTLLRSEVEQISSTGQSLMPEGLEQTLNPQEMADLIAFLRQGR